MSHSSFEKAELQIIEKCSVSKIKKICFENLNFQQNYYSFLENEQN